MVKCVSLLRRNASFVLAPLVLLLGLGGLAYSNGTSTVTVSSSDASQTDTAQTAASLTTRTSVPGCVEATSNGKYWEYRSFLVTGRKGGLAKGNNNVNGNGVNTRLSGYLRKAAGWDTKQHVANMENLESRLEEFQGAPGLVGKVWVEIAKKAMAHYGVDELTNNHQIDIDAWGRIDENNTAPHSNEKGFVYNAADGSGHIWATMCFELRFAGTSSNDDPDAKLRYSVKTEVAKCGFTVYDRGSGTGNSQVFTGSYIKFTANKVPSDFKIKLEAVNFLKGSTPPGYTCPAAPANGYVTIGAAYFDKNGDGAWENLFTPGNTHLFKSSPQACIDMFFAATSVPAEFTDLSNRPNYCLGRCANPPIINSGI